MGEGRFFHADRFGQLALRIVRLAVEGDQDEPHWQRVTNVSGEVWKVGRNHPLIATHITGAEGNEEPWALGEWSPRTRDHWQGVRVARHEVRRRVG
jgi:hypothetical protein